MQTELINVATGKRTSLTPNCDACWINPHAPRLNVEYARARASINEDFKLNFKMSQPTAKNIRKRSKKAVIEALSGVVSKNTEGKLIVTFPDQSVARL